MLEQTYDGNVKIQNVVRTKLWRYAVLDTFMVVGSVRPQNCSDFVQELPHALKIWIEVCLLNIYILSLHV